MKKNVKITLSLFTVGAIATTIMIFKNQSDDKAVTKNSNAPFVSNTNRSPASKPSNTPKTENKITHSNSKNNNDNSPKNQNILSHEAFAKDEKESVSHTFTKEEYAEVQNINFTLELDEAIPKEPYTKRARGEEAIKLMGSDIHRVAALNNISIPQLKFLLKNDKTVWVQSDGSLVVEENLLSGATTLNGSAVDTTTTTTTTTDPKAIDLANTKALLAKGYSELKLHSKPKASKTIYLNFTGKDLSPVGSTGPATLWGYSYNDKYFYSPALAIDADSASFSSTELGLIKNTWKMIAEDYAAFDVDVTTELPPKEKLLYDSPTDTIYGSEIVFTHSTKALCSATCGGVASINAYGMYKIRGSGMTSTTYDQFYKHAFVFVDKLASSAKYMADAASHETGHQLSLYHWGRSPSATNPGEEYFYGQGTGVTSYDPLMGASYRVKVAHFSKGEYKYARTTLGTLQDDIALVSKYLPKAKLDHGQTLTQAKDATIVSGAILQSGILTTGNDVALYKFNNISSKVVKFNLSNFALRTKVRYKLSILASNGTLLKTISPAADALDIATSLDLPAGTFFVKVESQTCLDPLTNGFSQYGQMGTFTLTSSIL